MEPHVRHISEREFAENLDRHLRKLAQAIAFSGLSLSEIAKGTRMKWDTVYAASQSRPVRMENAERIRYFLKVYRESNTKNDEKERPTNPAGKAPA
jgi:hypothetical protein